MGQLTIINQKIMPMQPTKASGRILGVLFLLSVLAGGTGTSMRGLSGVEANTVEFLQQIVENTAQMKMAIGLDMLGSAIGVLIAIFLFPFIKVFSSRLAVAYTAITCINFVIITVSNIIHVAMLSVGNDYSLSAGVDVQEFTLLSFILHDAYYWTHFLMLMLYAIGGSILYYFLLKSRLVPTWLSAWGLLAQAIVFVGGALQICGISVSFYLFLQNGVFVLVFLGWLLAMGFKIKPTD